MTDEPRVAVHSARNGRDDGQFIVIGGQVKGL